MPGPARLHAEHAALGVAVVAFTASAVALTIEVQTVVVVSIGVYAILGSLFGAGFVGWIVGAGCRCIRRDLSRAVAGQTKELADLRQQVQRQRVTYLPAPTRQNGHMYVAAYAESDPPAGGIDPDSILALRRINDRLRLVDN